MSLKGLTSFEVEERIRQGKINKNIDETDRPVWEIVKHFYIFQLNICSHCDSNQFSSSMESAYFPSNNCH